MGSSNLYGWDNAPVTNIQDYDSSMSKQHASVAWIVQKAHKNKVPADLQEPYYRDYEGQEHLKPGIVHRLANADLYCSALANIYNDPNFHNLSHWNIIQALARKGVYVAEPSDVALTETVLIQVTPIKISAHLAVIEAMMALYIREVVVAERVVQALQRVGGPNTEKVSPQDQEEALVLWVSQVTRALHNRISHQVSSGQDHELPVFPHIQDLSDLSDGIGLAALVSYYCPQELSWTDIAVADPPSMADSLYNIGLVIRFCHESLPYNPCLLTKEDIAYMHSSVKQNILAFVSELFFLFELEPVSCVTLSNNKQRSGKSSQLSSPGMKPAGVPSVRRSHSMNLNDMVDIKSRLDVKSEQAPSSYNSDYGGRESSMSDGQEGDFIVQRSRGVSTLGDMLRTQTSPRPTHDSDVQSIRSANRGRYNSDNREKYGSESGWDNYGMDKERYNIDSKEEEMGERRLSRKNSFHGSSQELERIPPAGVPTRIDERPKGRSRSRRNSINADESQLTIENFGGSQDNLNYISRNPDKDPFIHSGRRDSSGIVRDSRTYGRESREGSQQPPETKNTREKSVDRIPRMDLHRTSLDNLDNRVIDKLEREAFEREKRDLQRYSSKELLMLKESNKSNIEPIDSGSESDLSFDQDRQSLSKATSFAELSKVKEQIPLQGGINIIYMQSDKEDSGHKSAKHKGNKKTTFAALPNQTTWKQQIAQTQSDDNKSIGDENIEPQVMTTELHNVRLKLEEKRKRIESDKRKMELMMNKQRQKLGKEAFMQAVVKGEIGNEVSNVSRKWLEDSQGQVEELRTPDLETMDYDEYHKSLTQMNDSLTEIQGDIQRLTGQQHQIQSLMHNGVNQQNMAQNQFYLHDQGSPARRMWGQPVNSEGYATMSPATRRSQWGPARPMMSQGEFIMNQHQQPQPQSGYYQPYPSHPNQQLPPMNQMNNHGQMHQPPGHGFMLHGQPQPQSLPNSAQGPMYQNGQNYYNSPEHQYRGFQQQQQQNMYGADPQRGMGGQGGPGGQFAPFRLHGDGPPGEDSRGSGSLKSSAHSSPSRQLSQSNQNIYQHQPKSPSPSRQSSVTHAPVAAPPPDDMEPQNVYFIDSQNNDNDGVDVDGKLKRLSISSGNRTYRISHEPGSPTRPSIGTKTFRVPTKKGVPVQDDVDLPRPTPVNRSYSPDYPPEEDDNEDIKTEPLQDGVNPDKGFYISFDDDGAAPRKPKPKPPLRSKKMARKSSAPSTPLSTPNREESPFIPERSKNSSNSMLDLSGSSNFVGSPQTPNYRNSMPTSPNSSLSYLNNVTSPLSVQNGRGQDYEASNNQRDSPEDSEESDYSNSRMNSMPKVTPKKKSNTALVIGDELVNQDDTMSDMERKKEKLMMMSMKRKQQQEEARRKKEMESEQRREDEKRKEEEKLRKKEEEKARRDAILERHKIKKAIEEAEKEGRHYVPPPGYQMDPPGPPAKQSVRLRKAHGSQKQRPKTMHEASFGDAADGRLSASGKKGSTQNLAGEVSGSGSSRNIRKSSGRWGSSQSLTRAGGSRGSTNSLAGDYPSGTASRTLERGHTGRRPTSVIGTSSSMMPKDSSGKTSQRERQRTRPNSLLGGSTSDLRKRSASRSSRQSEHDSLVYHMSEDSGLGRATPPRRAPSPGMASRHLPSPSGQPGSLPPGLFSRRRPGAFDDAASDVSSTASSSWDYSGPRLFKQPTAKSNRSIILNAVEYCVFPGVVNQTAKRRVMEEVARSEAKHFLVLFRDSGCQFRALYSFDPDTEEVYKIYGTGPKQVTDRMYEKFFKYNSGGKCFSQIHTKTLTVTIDAFTIHNSLWQGKKMNLPSKKDMTLVI